MNEKELTESGYKYIPHNILKNYTFFSIPIIRWIDACIFSLIVALLVLLTPFVIKIKIISITVIDISITTLCLHGVKNRSITELFIDILHDKKQYGKYSLQNISTIKRKKMKQQVNYDNESAYERLIRNIKTGFKEFDEKYDK